MVSTAESATLENVRLEIVGYSSLTMDVPDLTMTGIYQSVRLVRVSALVSPASVLVPLCLPPLSRKSNSSSRMTIPNGNPVAVLHAHVRLSIAALPQRRRKKSENLSRSGHEVSTC